MGWMLIVLPCTEHDVENTSCVGVGDIPVRISLSGLADTEVGAVG